MQDQAPLNRAARRAAQRKRPAKGLAQMVGRGVPHSHPNQKSPQDPATSGGAPLDQEEDDMAGPQETIADKPPTDRKPSHHRGAGEMQRIRDTLVTYYALAGMGIARIDQMDGQLVMAMAEDAADAWIAAGKANPQIMRALKVITIAGPYTALIMIHAKVATDIMNRHNASPLSLFRRVEQTENNTIYAGPASVASPDAPQPMAYQPAGPSAPTEAAPPPGLMVFPDEGLPADMEVELRQVARQTGKPYNELRDAVLLALAQERMQQNGRVQSPGALGAPVSKE